MKAIDEASPMPRDVVVITVERHLAQSLAQSGDEALRAIARERLLRQKALTEEEEGLLRKAIPTLSFDLLLELLDRHGDLGCPAAIVAQLVATLPKDHDTQAMDLLVFGRLDHLRRVLDTDAYADFVEKARLILSDVTYPKLLAYVRGGDLFNAVCAKDSERPDHVRDLAPEPLATQIIDVRYDESACRARLEARINAADHGDLLRLVHVLSEAGCTDLAESAWERSLQFFRFPSRFKRFRTEETNQERRTADYHWILVQDWVLEAADDHDQRLAWLADRVIELELDRFPFVSHFTQDEVPDELRDALVRVLLNRGELPEWAGPALVVQLETRSLEAWNNVFAWWERWDYRRFGWDYHQHKSIITAAPLPEAAPEAFDDAFLRCARDVMAFEERQLGDLWEQYCRRSSREAPRDASVLEMAEQLSRHPFWHRLIEAYLPLLTLSTAISRLLEMTLTPARAARVVRMLKDCPELMRDPRMIEVTALSGPLEADTMPPFERFDLTWPDQVTLYRRLGGAMADARLREHVRARLQKSAAASSSGPFGAMHLSCWQSWVPEIADDALRTELQDRIRETPLDEVLRWQSYRGMAWLLDEPLLHEVAQRHLDAGHPWDNLLRLPPTLRPFVEARARQTEDDSELFRLLTWLEAQGTARVEWIAILLERLERRPPSSDLTRVVSLLVTRSAWEKEGARFLRAFLRWDDWDLLAQLWISFFVDGIETLAKASAETPKPDLGPLLSAVHLAFATVLLELAAAAAQAHDEARLQTLLAAVLKLDPPPPIVRELRKLARTPNLSERAKERIAFGMKLFKSAEGRAPSFDGLSEATAILRIFRRTPTRSAKASSPNV